MEDADTKAKSLEAAILNERALKEKAEAKLLVAAEAEARALAVSTEATAAEENALKRNRHLAAKLADLELANSSLVEAELRQRTLRTEAESKALEATKKVSVFASVPVS